MAETFSQPQIAGFPSSPRLMTLSVHAGEVFANREKALHSLQSPNPSLEGKTPLEAAKTEQGYKAVEDILGRIEYVVFG